MANKRSKSSIRHQIKPNKGDAKMAMDTLIGKMAFGYELREMIAAGGFARVYRAEHPKAHNVVAVKVFPKLLAEDEGFKERFEREEEAWGRLKGPDGRWPYSIVEFKTGGVENLGPAIVMEYVEGPSLDAKALPEKTPMPLMYALEIASQLLAALEYAHSKGVVHGDVHPGNVLLGKEGVKLTDFGLTRIIGEDEGARARYSPLTSPGLGLYSPPEADMGRAKTAQSDIYQAGLVLAYMLGRRPKNLKPLQKINPAVKDGLAEIIDTSLEYEPRDRYASAAEFAAAINGYVNPAQFRKYPVRIRQLLGENTDGVLDPEAISEIGQKRSELESIAAERGLPFSPVEMVSAITSRRETDTRRIAAYVQRMKGMPRPIPQPQKPPILAQLQQYKAAVAAWGIGNLVIQKTW